MKPLSLGLTFAAAACAVLGVLFAMERTLTAAPDPTGGAPGELWEASALDLDGSVRGSARICADSTVRAGFGVMAPVINGAPCAVVARSAVSGGSFGARCVASGQRYALNVTQEGDAARDFTVRMRLTPLQSDHPGALQVLRYRKVGACPAKAVGEVTKG